MADNLGTALRGAGAAQSFATGTSPEREANRATARAGKEEADQKLARLKATKLTAADHENLADVQTLKIKNLEAQQMQTLRDANEKTTYNAWGRYDEHGEVRPLNQMLSDLGDSSLFEGIVRFDNLTEADSELMTQAGDVDQDKIINDPTVSRSFVKATMEDGSTQIMNLDDLKGRTRYNKYAQTEELARMKESKEILFLDSMGYDSSPAGREAFRRARAELGPDVDPKSPAFQDSITKHLDKATALKKTRYGSGSLTQDEAEAERLANLDGLYKGDEGYNEAYQGHFEDIAARDARTSTIKDIEAADVLRADLDTIAGGSFAEADLSDPAERGKYARTIQKLKQQTKYKPAESTKKVLRQMRSVVNLGETASQITEDQTGVFDSIFHDVKKYITNNVDGVRETASLAWMNNVARNILFGATLPAAEIKAFTQAAGSQKQQLAPLLDAMAVNLGQIRDEISHMLATGDPDITRWELGMTEDQANDVLDAIDDTIANLHGEMETLNLSGKPATTAADLKIVPESKSTLTPERRAGLQKIYEGLGDTNEN